MVAFNSRISANEQNPDGGFRYVRDISVRFGLMDLRQALGRLELVRQSSAEVGSGQTFTVAASPLHLSNR